MQKTEMHPRERLVLGLMSGTSMDGIDVALVNLAGSVKLVAFATYPYPDHLRTQMLRLAVPGQATVEDICHMNFVLGEIFAQAALRLVESAGVPLDRITAIGSHGQTIYHIPDKRLGVDLDGRPLRTRSTLQIGEPAVIAQRTGITCVADFRVRDVAAGGLGAPLVPLADYLLFAHPTEGRVIQNIGGIGNMTVLPAGGGLDDLFALDTGPGNMVIDGLVRLFTGGVQSFDAQGAWAAKGRVHDEILSELMQHPFLAMPYPKTTGREMFGEAFVQNLVARAEELGLSTEQTLATATQFTAESIALHLRRDVFPVCRVDRVVLGGGGSHNQTLVSALQRSIYPVPVVKHEDLGWDGDAKEAVAFALLADRALQGLPGNVPKATGAQRPEVLGKIVPATRHRDPDEVGSGRF